MPLLAPETRRRWIVRIAILGGLAAGLAWLPGDGGAPRAQPSPAR